MLQDSKSKNDELCDVSHRGANQRARGNALERTETLKICPSCLTAEGLRVHVAVFVVRYVAPSSLVDKRFLKPVA